MLIGAGMLIGLSARAELDLNVLHDRNPLFVTLSDGTIRNGYTIKILNKSRAPRGVRAVDRRARGRDARGRRPGPGRSDRAVLAARPDAVTTYRVHVSAPRARSRAARPRT